MNKQSMNWNTKDTQNTERRKESTRKNKKKTTNSFIVNFSPYEIVDDLTIRRVFEPFGVICAVIMCTIDACQAFITMQDNEYSIFDEPNKMNPVDRIFDITNGIINVEGLIWTLCRPEIWKMAKKCTYGLIGDTCSLKESTDDIMKIYENYHSYWSSMSQSTSSIYKSISDKFNSSSTVTLTGTMSYEYPDYISQSSNGYRPHSPSYYLLPDTPYFRNAHIIPPPLSDNLSIQTIIDRYIISMRNHDRMIDEYIYYDYYDDITICEDSLPLSPIQLTCPWWSF